MKKPKSKLEWFKKNIVIVPVVAAIIAGTFTSVRYVLSLTDTIDIKPTNKSVDLDDKRFKTSCGRKILQILNTRLCIS